MDEKKEVKEFTTEELAQCIPAPADLKAPFVFEVEGVPMVAKPVGRHSWEVTGREDLLQAPTRIKNFFLLFNDIESFCQYVKDYKTDSTNLYLTKSIKSLIFMASAVFNDIKRDQPNWRDQVANLKKALNGEIGIPITRSGCHKSNLLSFLTSTSRTLWEMESGLQVLQKYLKPSQT